MKVSGKSQMYSLLKELALKIRPLLSLEDFSQQDACAALAELSAAIATTAICEDGTGVSYEDWIALQGEVGERVWGEVRWGYPRIWMAS